MSVYINIISADRIEMFPNQRYYFTVVDRRFLENNSWRNLADLYKNYVFCCNPDVANASRIITVSRSVGIINTRECSITLTEWFI